MITVLQTLAGCVGLPPEALEMLKSVWISKLKLSEDELDRELENVDNDADDEEEDEVIYYVHLY